MTSENKNLPALHSHKTNIELPTLAAGLVHEVRNPLAAIHMHLQLLENYVQEVDNTELRNKIQQKILIVKDEIINLNQTLNSFFSLLQPKKQKQEQSFGLDILIEQIVTLLKPQLNRENIQIHFEGDKIKKIEYWDQSFLRQIILNLVLNAVQAFKKCSDQKREAHIYINTKKHEKLIYIRISDNGPGISKGVQEKMFDAFYSTKQESGGSGLGLTLVQHMIRNMGAQLQVESKTGQGTSFTIILDKTKSNQKLLK